MECDTVDSCTFLSPYRVILNPECECLQGPPQAHALEMIMINCLFIDATVNEYSIHTDCLAILILR